MSSLENEKIGDWFWRKAFTSEYDLPDYDCDAVWVRTDKYKMVKFPSTFKIDGKWGVFDKDGEFIDRRCSDSPPFLWANAVIKMFERQKTKSGIY